MPQLDPAPWFSILSFSWLIFLTVIPPKVLAHSFPNEPARQGSDLPEADSWNWPWH